MSKVTIWDSGERGKFPEQLAHELLEKYGHPCANAVKELHGTFLSLSMRECADILYAVHDEMREEALQEENARLRELVAAFSDCRNTTCDDCVRWDYSRGECTLDEVMRELGIERWTR